MAYQNKVQKKFSYELYFGISAFEMMFIYLLELNGKVFKMFYCTYVQNTPICHSAVWDMFPRDSPLHMNISAAGSVINQKRHDGLEGQTKKITGSRGQPIQCGLVRFASVGPLRIASNFQFYTHVVSILATTPGN